MKYSPLCLLGKNCVQRNKYRDLRENNIFMRTYLIYRDIQSLHSLDKLLENSEIVIVEGQHRYDLVLEYVDTMYGDYRNVD